MPSPDYAKHLAGALERQQLRGLHPAAEKVPWSLDHEYEDLRNDVEANGFLDPIKVTSDGLVLDGRIRLCVAGELGTGVEVKTVDPEDPIAYVMSCQTRRNLTTGQRAMLATEFEAMYSEDAKERQEATIPQEGQRGFQRASVPENFPEHSGDDTHDKEAREQAAKAVGVSGRSVSEAKKLKQEAPDLAEEVGSGEKSLHAARKEAQERKAVKGDTPHMPTFNETNDNIEWAKWTWNPVTGCKHGCPYCYARDIAMRFDGSFGPRFRPNRLSAPQNTKVPKAREGEGGIRNVFVCSMADLFGAWVPAEWIEKVLDAVRGAPQWTFLFLTKNPQRYAEFDFPANAWLGATADTQARMDVALESFRTLDTPAPVLFVSCEPLEEAIRIPEGARLDWVIIGGRSKTSGMPANQPKWEWVEGLLGDARANGAMVYFKPNLTVRPKEYPKEPT